jgi:AraC-like DNA-binding protein
MTQTSTVLHSGGCLDVLDVRCGCASGHRDEEETAGFELVVPLAGAFVRRSAQGEALVDSSFGYVAHAGGAQEITHVSDGDRCVALVPSPGVADAVGLGDGAASGVVPIDRRRQRLVARALAAPPADPLAGEEAWLGVLSGLSAPAGSWRPSTRTQPARRDAVRRVREAILDDPGAAWTVPALAEVAGYAPHHLSRVFRSVTGTTVSEYRERVRLGAAITLLRDGQPVADVAARLGYCDQAHLARRAGEVLGLAPSALRAGPAGRAGLAG